MHQLHISAIGILILLLLTSSDATASKSAISSRGRAAASSRTNRWLKSTGKRIRKAAGHMPRSGARHHALSLTDTFFLKDKILSHAFNSLRRELSAPDGHDSVKLDSRDVERLGRTPARPGTTRTIRWRIDRAVGTASVRLDEAGNWKLWEMSLSGHFGTHQLQQLQEQLGAKPGLMDVQLDLTSLAFLKTGQAEIRWSTASRSGTAIVTIPRSDRSRPRLISVEEESAHSPPGEEHHHE